MRYGGGVDGAGGELVRAEVLEVPSVILVEAVESVVEVDWGGEGFGEGEGPFASNGAGECAVGVLDVNFLAVGSREDEAKSQPEADGA
jgi:hypothetical protein